MHRTDLGFYFLQAHSNAVFDLAGVPGEHRIVSSHLPPNFMLKALAAVCRE